MAPVAHSGSIKPASRAPLLLLALGLAAILLSPLPFLGARTAAAAPASGYTVNTPVDSIDAHPGDNHCADAGGQCSLRAAVMEADAHPGPDSIHLPANTYSLTLSGGSEDTALTGDLDLSGTVTLQGAGAASTIIDATGLGDRVFQVLAGAQVSLADLTVRGGAAPSSGDKRGGGVLNSGTLTLTRATLARNNLGGFDIGQNGGGLANDFDAQALLDSSLVISNQAEIAAGVWNEGEMTLRNSQVVTNIADYGGGIFNDGTLSVTHSQVLSNAGGIFGGGIYNNGGLLTLDQSLVSGNRSPIAGGVWQEQGEMVIRASTLRDNAAGGRGGGLTLEAGTLTVVGSTLTSNQAGTDGGGIYLKGPGDLRVVNSTLAENYANNNGGGVYLDGGAFTGFNLTIASNLANADDHLGGTGGGLARGISGTLALSNTLLAGNLHVFNQTAFSDNCAGTFAIFHYSLVETEAGCVFTHDHDLIGQGPVLGALANNSGPTLTMALGAGSPAIDAGDPSGCTGPDGSRLATDQRGLPRHADGDRDGTARCDMGAYEAVLQLFLPLLRR